MAACVESDDTRSEAASTCGHWTAPGDEDEEEEVVEEVPHAHVAIMLSHENVNQGDVCVSDVAYETNKEHEHEEVEVECEGVVDAHIAEEIEDECEEMPQAPGAQDVLVPPSDNLSSVCANICKDLDELMDKLESKPVEESKPGEESKPVEEKKWLIFKKDGEATKKVGMPESFEALLELVSEKYGTTPEKILDEADGSDVDADSFKFLRSGATLVFKDNVQEKQFEKVRIRFKDSSSHTSSSSAISGSSTVTDKSTRKSTRYSKKRMVPDSGALEIDEILDQRETRIHKFGLGSDFLVKKNDKPDPWWVHEDDLSESYTGCEAWEAFDNKRRRK